MRNSALLLVVGFVLALTSCGHKKSAKASSDSANVTSSTEVADAGWVSLFDGETLEHWHAYRHDTETSGWIVTDGAIQHDKSVEAYADLVSDEEYEDFELELEWKIQDCGNSGIFWNVIESPDYQYVWLTGPEMQVLDNACHPDAEFQTHRAGDLYDLISVSTETVRPAGEWNQVRIRTKDAKVSFWLNGENVVNFEMHTPQWTEMVANSKFKEMLDFGKARKGHIALQDHSDDVWYRNIRIRRL